MNGLQLMTKMIKIRYAKLTYLISYSICKFLPIKVLRIYLELLWKIESIIDTLNISKFFYISNGPEEVYYHRNCQYRKKMLKHS